MRAPYILSEHALFRLRERCSVPSPESDLKLHPSLTEVSVSLSSSKHNEKDEATGHRLCYFRSGNVFAVLIIQTDLSRDAVNHHIVKTAITPEMFEADTGQKLTDKEFCRAAHGMLGPVMYRAWSLGRYGKIMQVNRTTLKVHFKTSPHVWEVKVRNKVCDGFKENEPLEATLAHPGVITSANEQLTKIGRTLSERHFMRLHSDLGTLKLTELEARPCPYCGMQPLDTDISAAKDDVCT